MHQTRISSTRPSPNPGGFGSTAAPVKAADPDEFMTVPDVATACKLSETTVRRAIRTGELPAYKLRSRTRIKRAEYAAWIEAHRQAQSLRPERVLPRARLVAQPAPGTFRAILHAEDERRRAS